MNWGYRIVLAFVLFAGFTFFLVYKSFKERIDLVSENYYEEELKYQDKIDKKSNTANLKEDVEIKVDKDIEVRFPAEIKQPITGKILFFRPSDSRLDYRLEISPDSTGVQRVARNKLSQGYYTVMIEWKAGNEEYYSEKTINLK